MITALAVLAAIALLTANVVALLVFCLAVLLAAHALLKAMASHAEAILVWLIEMAVITAFCAALVLVLNGQLPGGLPSPYDPVLDTTAGRVLAEALIGYAWLMYILVGTLLALTGVQGILAEQFFGADDEPWRLELGQIEARLERRKAPLATTDAEFHERLVRAQRMVEEDPSILGR